MRMSDEVLAQCSPFRDIKAGKYAFFDNETVVFGRRATMEGFFTDWSKVSSRLDAGFKPA